MTFAELDMRCTKRFTRLLKAPYELAKKLYLPPDSQKFSELIETILNLSERPEIGEAEVKEFKIQLEILRDLRNEIDPEHAQDANIVSFFNGLNVTINTLNGILGDFKSKENGGIPDYLLGDQNIRDLLLGDNVDNEAPGTVIYIPDSLFQSDEEIGNPETDPDEIKDRPLFPNGNPKVGDIIQKEDAACFLLANLVGFANSNPDAIKKMISDNDDGTVTVHLHALRHGTKVPLNIRIDKTVGSMDKDSAVWVKYVEKAVAASHLIQTSGDYPEGLRKLAERKRLPKFSISNNLNGGAPELAFNILAQEDTIELNKLQNDMMLSKSFDTAKSLLMEKMRRALKNDGSIFMYTGNHVVSINAVSMENGQNIVSVYDQNSAMNRDGYATKVRLEDILSGKIKSHDLPFTKIQINEPEMNGPGIKTDSVYLVGLEYEYARFQRPAEEAPKPEEIQPQLEPDGQPIPQQKEPDNQINLQQNEPEDRPLLRQDDSEDQLDLQPDVPEEDPVPQLAINPREAPHNLLPTEVIVARIARLNKEMQATATFTPKTSRAMMENLNEVNRFAQEHKDDPAAISSIFDSECFEKFMQSASHYIDTCDAASKEGYQLNSKQLAKIKVCNKLAGLGTAVTSGYSLAEYKKYMLAEKLVIQEDIGKYRRAPTDGLGDLRVFHNLKQATLSMIKSDAYNQLLTRAKVDTVDSPNMAKLIKTPSEKLIKVMPTKKAAVQPQIQDDQDFILK